MRDQLKQVKRVLIKVGSNVLTGPEGPKEEVIFRLAQDISSVKKKGYEVIMVSSGAISCGLRKMGFSSRPTQLSQLQALAAIGQGALMGMYEKEFEKWDTKVAQILITKEDLGSRKRYLNILNTLFTLLHWGVIPIINENDTVTVDEIKFGDNDNLAALIAIFTECQLFVNLTSTEGLYEKDPKQFSDARLVHTVEKIDKVIFSYASKDKSLFGTGGMESKLMAAKKVAMAGIPTVIANGTREMVVSRLLMGEEIGTFIMASDKRIPKKKHWLAFGSYPKGVLVVDPGAEGALLRNGKSLLPSGISKIEGSFERGDPVLIRNLYGETLGVGIVNYRARDLEKIIGRSSKELEHILGFKFEDEVIHRNNMVLISKLK